MSNSTNLTLPFLTLGQAQKHVTINESLLRLDALVQLAVVSASTSAEPGAPSDGQVYIVPSGKTGTHWSAMTNWALAYYRDGVWEQISPREGFVAYVKDTDQIVAYNGATWASVGGVSASRQVSAGGLATGGGDLSADRTITVTAASDAEARAGAATNRALTPANLASRGRFKAHKNGTDQTGVADLTATKVTFGTEVYDVGSHFASNAWTPPAGVPIQLNGVVNVTGLAAGAVAIAYIYKNGALLQAGNWTTAWVGGANCTVCAADVPNGTDYYELYLVGTDFTTTGTVKGTVTDTVFWGSQI